MYSINTSARGWDCKRNGGVLTRCTVRSVCTTSSLTGEGTLTVLLGYNWSCTLTNERYLGRCACRRNFLAVRLIAGSITTISTLRLPFLTSGSPQFPATPTFKQAHHTDQLQQMAPTKVGEAETASRIQEELASTEYACSSLTPLSGGTASATSSNSECMCKMGIY